MDDRARSTFDLYPIRCMLGLTMSLGLLVVLVHLPVYESPDRVGWTHNTSAERIALSDVTPESPDPAPNETFSYTSPLIPEDDLPPKPTNPSVAQEDAAEGSSQGESENEAAQNDMQLARALSVADQQPEILGGMGSLYLNIHYPDEARAQGIQGRLMLEFTVTRDGRVKHVQVAESLHPLCDSAAVRGVQSVDFIPAKQNGEPIPVRLRLPIRFKLANVATAAQSSRPNP
jgi:TonB family protein